MHFISMHLGILDWLIAGITQLFVWLVELILFVVQDVFGGLLFALGAELMSLIDFAQNIFKILAGLDTSFNGETGTSSDLILQLVLNPTVLDVFLALSILSVVIVFIGTIIQIIRSEYTTEGSKNTKGAIFGSALKSLAMFFIVPIAAIMGILLSNFLLRSIDAATQRGASAGISNSIFIASSYEANMFRVPQDAPADSNTNQVTAEFRVDINEGKVSWYYGGQQIIIGYKTNPQDSNFVAIDSVQTSDTSAASMNNVADLIDTMFRGGFYIWVQDANAENPGVAVKFLKAINVNAITEGDTVVLINSCYTYSNGSLLKMFYKTSDMNFIILFFGCGFALYSLYMAAFGMAKRLFKAVILLIISPPIVGLMPLDGGGAFKEWRKNFISEIIIAYGTIVALNVLFLLLPVLQNINIFDPSVAKNKNLNLIAQMLFVIVGCLMVKDSAGLISTIINEGAMSFKGGTTDLIGSGKDTVQKVGKAASSVATGAASVYHRGMQAVDNMRAMGAAYNGNSERAQELRNRANAHRQTARSQMQGLRNNVRNSFGLKDKKAKEGTRAQRKGKDVSANAARDRINNGKGTLMDKFRASDQGFAGAMNKVFRPMESSVDYAEQATTRRELAKASVDELYKDDLELHDKKIAKSAAAMDGIDKRLAKNDISDEEKAELEKKKADYAAKKKKEEEEKEKILEKMNAMKGTISSARDVAFDSNGNMVLKRTLKQTRKDFGKDAKIMWQNHKINETDRYAERLSKEGKRLKKQNISNNPNYADDLKVFNEDVALFKKMEAKKPEREAKIDQHKASKSGSANAALNKQIAEDKGVNMKQVFDDTAKKVAEKAAKDKASKK